MKNNFYLVTVFIFLLTACQNDDSIKSQNNEEVYQEVKFENINFNEKDKLKEQFGRALALAMKENESLRIFIKEEALKKFNLDYDVMYHLVKNKPLENNIRLKNTNNKGNETFRGLLLNYFDEEADLIAIEKQLPLLTIFVPELPENSFSAENWDTATTTPAAGIRLTDANEIPVIDAVYNIDYVIEADVTPGYPIVVVKDNERLQVITSANNNLVSSTDVLSNGDGVNYRFLSDAFNPKYNSASSKNSNTSSAKNLETSSKTSCLWPGEHQPGRESTVQAFETNAYNVFNNVVTDFWMRDNIYYQQTPTNSVGQFTGNKYRETITWFKFTGEPILIWNRLADQSNTTGDRDPQIINQNWTRGQYSAWSDGQFEISVSCTDNSKTRGDVNTYSTLPFRPQDLFSFTHEHVDRRRWGFSRRYYRPVISGTVAVNMTNPSLTTAIFRFNNWSLLQYSNTWTYAWKEVDNTVEQSLTTTAERKFNSNIEANVNATIPGTGSETKLGLKWGASLEDKQGTSRTSKWTVGSENIGICDVNFYDKTINLNPCNNTFYPTIYRAGSVIFEVRPVQVQW